jgi:hypothetical protein
MSNQARRNVHTRVVRSRGKQSTHAEEQRISTVVHKVMKKQREVFYADTAYTAITLSTTFTFNNTGTNITQGVAQGQRPLDVIYLDHVEFNANLSYTGVNIVSTARLVFFRWFEGSNVTPPTSAQVLTPVGSSIVFYPFFYENRKIVQQVGPNRIFCQAGLAASPTNTSNLDISMSMGLGGARVDFVPGTTPAIGHLFLLYVSDQAAAGPVLNGHLRLWYHNEPP